MIDPRGSITLRILRSRLRLRRAFTVIESLLSFVVILIGVVATLGTLASSFGNVDTNGERIQAVAAAQQYMDSIRRWEQNGETGIMPAPPTIAIDAGQNNQGTGAPLTSPGNFDFTIAPATCTQAGSGGANSKQYDCKVTVGWTISGFTRQLTVESYVTRQQ